MIRIRQKRGLSEKFWGVDTMKMHHLLTALGMPTILAGVLLFSETASVAADYELIPKISVSEEYTDNVNETVAGKREEFITRAQPGFSLKYKAPRLDLSTIYNFDYRYYAKGRKGDEYTHFLNAAGTLAMVENFLYLDASDTYKRVSLDVARDNTSESLYLNQSDQNVGRVSPYILWRYRGNSSIKTGYSYTNTWYREPSGIDKREHGASFGINHELSPGVWLTAAYEFTDADTSIEKYRRHNAYGGFRYEYAEKSFIFGQAGNTWQYYNNGLSVNNVFWSAGLTHDFNFVVATAETRVQYTEDPLRSSIKETLYSGRLSRSFDRGSVEASVGYSEFEIIETGMLDRRRFSVSAGGKYEVVEHLTLSLGGAGERYSARSATDYPYRFTGNAGGVYALSNSLNLGLSYSYITNRYAIDESAGSRNTNRVILELTKTF